MPRVRKQVARFDPSPEAVASWNDTSSKVRVQIDLQARVRHGLATAEAAAALAAANAASEAATGANAADPKTKAASRTQDRKEGLPGPGRKRQRTIAAATSGGEVLRYDGRAWPPISDLRGGRGMGMVATATANIASGRDVRVGSSVTDSMSWGTSGSDSDSSYSCASVISDRNLPWRGVPVAGASSGDGVASTTEADSIGENVSACASASLSGTDTDSEYSSDLVPAQTPTTSASSDTGSSCSAPPPLDAIGGGQSARVGGGSGGENKSGSRAGSGTKSGGESGGEVLLPQCRLREDVEESERVKKRRNVVTVRLARSKMPARWAKPPPAFKTCLDDIRPEDRLGVDSRDGDDATAAAAAAAASIFGISEEDTVDRENWLYSGLIDVVMAKLARTYPNVHFMPIDFAFLCLNGWGSSETVPAPSASPSLSSSPSSTSGGDGGAASAAAAATALKDQSMVFHDILGRPIVYSEKRSVVFLTHVNNVHWNLLRVEHDPVPELQLFEPMGKPPRRQGGSRTNTGRGAPGGTGFRCIPNEVYRWLDTVWPLQTGNGDGVDGSGSGGASTAAATAAGSRGLSGSKRKLPSPNPSKNGWKCRSYSAIKEQQQTTGFDCGVASLLYAEKCGQGQMRDDIDAWTTQEDMTEYRRALQRYFKEIVLPNGSESPDSISPASCSSYSMVPGVVDLASSSSPPPPPPPPSPTPPPAPVATPAPTWPTVSPPVTTGALGTASPPIASLPLSPAAAPLPQSFFEPACASAFTPPG